VQTRKALRQNAEDGKAHYLLGTLYFSRGLTEEAGTDSETGAILYRTTGYFLERLGLASLEDLPDLAPFLPENIEDIEDENARS